MNISRLVAALGAVIVGVAILYGAVADPLGLLDRDRPTVIDSAPAAAGLVGPAGSPTAIDSEPVPAVAADDGGDVNVGSSEAPIAPELGVPPLATRYIDLPTTRVLDTRDGDGPPVEPWAVAAADIGQLVPDSAITVVLSVSLATAQGPGPVEVEAGGASITAFEVSEPGQMATNLVLVPYLAGEPVTVTTAGGGHLVVDAVGYFEESDAVADGRFVPVATQRIARLVTEIDGREAIVSPLANPALPESGVSSVLVRISADVGRDGGMVRLGDSLDGLSNTMTWAATSGDDRTRQGVAIVSLSELDELALTYSGGAVLDVDVLGYFTDETALVAEVGLFEPRPDNQTITVELAAGESATVNAAEELGIPAEAIGAVPINVFATAATSGDLFVYAPGQRQPGSATVELGGGRSRFGFTATEVGSDGSIVVTSDVDVTVTIVVPGYFRS